MKRFCSPVAVQVASMVQRLVLLDQLADEIAQQTMVVETYCRALGMASYLE